MQTITTTTTENLTPALANAIARVLQLAAQAAMQGRSDRDLLNAIQAIQAETFAAEMEYHGADEPTPDDVPF